MENNENSFDSLPIADKKIEINSSEYLYLNSIHLKYDLLVKCIADEHVTIEELRGLIEVINQI